MNKKDVVVRRNGYTLSGIFREDIHNGYLSVTATITAKRELTEADVDHALCTFNFINQYGRIWAEATPQVVNKKITVLYRTGWDA